MFTTLILFSLILFVVFISISGFGKLLLNLSNLNIQLIHDFKSLEFIFGLIAVGFFAILLNVFISINDIVTSFLILLGIAVYFFFFFKNENKKNEIFLIFFLVTASLFFSFYSLSNDDFDYHFKTIMNFKELDVFKIVHERRTSYNSHWLLINAAFYLKSYPASVFCITSLLYNLIVFDFYRALKRGINNSNFLASIYSFLALVFLFGVINQYKEWGTDFPGQIILLCIFLIYFENNKKIIENNEYKIFVILVLISVFAFTIKISNSLIFIFLLFIFFQMKRKVLLFFYCLPCIVPAFLWFLHNFIITECLIWPVSFTCFDNVNEAKTEMLIIERFAKGDETQTFSTFNWISLWLRNHFPKILEIYALYFILLTISPFIYIFKNREQKSKSLLDSSSDLYRLEISNPYFVFAIISIFCSVIWLIYSPAYRFGIIYNLNLLIIFLIPAWHSMFIQGKKFFKRSIKIFISISLVFFVYNNIDKYQKYIERHGTKWPNIVDNKYYYKKGLIN